MTPDNDDCDYLTGITGRPLAGASVQTVPEPWSYTCEGGECGGSEREGADDTGALALMDAMIQLLPVASAVCESVKKDATARTLAALLMDAHRVRGRLLRAGIR